ncbi:platelet-activating factor acetylhydrolase, isoform II-domain-containing protein [Mycena rosella]|uniref:1-alkyl-2-acetylglycerophosphocholine esterase n=1 Tax=Mycena rosella TaxID=1033263 RepID=A0AAD7GAS1_MYCRO|nr:platelet-activating factor acetylhydrolase, isoform II-domain-containing protein [Mycena rosella]
MFSLRPPRGPFPVAALTFVAPVSPALTVGDATLAATNIPALVLEELAFTVYYPADPSPRANKGLNWLLRPVNAVLRGFAHFTGAPVWLMWPVVYLFGTVLKIPVYPNAPLLHPGDTRKQWPLVIFSHGLAGSRTAYSQLCSEMAAAGRVVLAIEHRDGTAPACAPRGRTVLYYREDDVAFPPDTEGPPAFPLRAEQLAFRQHEVYRIYAAFCGLVRDGPGAGAGLAAIDGADVDLGSWTPAAGLPVVDCDDLALAGHSFGGCTMLSILSSPSGAYPPLPVTKVLLYDPWLEPLPTPGPTPTASISRPSTSTLSEGTPPSESESELKSSSALPKMLVINSQVFSLWKDHFSRLAGVVDAWEPQGRRLLTLVGSKHVSFSDFPVLPLVRTKAATTLMERTAMLSLAFLDGTLDAALERVPTRKMVEKVIGKRKDGRPKRTIVGEVGDVVVH